MAASSGTVHALMDVVLPDGLTVGLAGILRSTVTVDDCTFQCGISSQSIFQCMDTQICFHSCFHCQSKDAKIKAVENRRYIQFSIGRRDLRDVCNTFFQWGICMEIPFQQISDFMDSRSAFVIPFGFLFGRWLRPIWFITRYTVRSLGIRTPSGCFSSA